MIGKTVRKLSERVNWLLKTVRLLRNWPEVYWRKFVVGRAGERQSLRLRSGLEFEVLHKDRSFPILAEVLDRQVYRPGLLAPSQLSPDPVVIDIGGNIGASAVYFLTQMPTARCLVFEPEPDNYALLKTNLKRNGFESRATALQQGVAGSEGHRTLYFATNSPTNSMYRPEMGSPIEVECTSLQRIFDTHRIDHCDLMKIDCEGAEYEILMTAPGPLLGRVRRIILEWHQVLDHTPEALEEHLRRAGFRTYRPERRFIVADNSAMAS